MTFEVEKHGFDVFQCRICQRPIVWAWNDGNGRKIPLDPVAPTFAAKLKQPGKKTIVARKVDLTKNGELVLVSHFSTCPSMMKVGKFTTAMRKIIRKQKEMTPEEFVRRTNEAFREHLA